jgi:hypothetical protein
LIERLNTQIGATLAGNEQMFLNSYRDHMEAVSKELIRFRKVAKEREFDLRRDKKIAKLQG